MPTGSRKERARVIWLFGLSPLGPRNAPKVEDERHQIEEQEYIITDCFIQ